MITTIDLLCKHLQFQNRSGLQQDCMQQRGARACDHTEHLRFIPLHSNASQADQGVTCGRPRVMWGTSSRLPVSTGDTFTSTTSASSAASPHCSAAPPGSSDAATTNSSSDGFACQGNAYTKTCAYLYCSRWILSCGVVSIAGHRVIDRSRNLPEVEACSVKSLHDVLVPLVQLLVLALGCGPACRQHLCSGHHHEWHRDVPHPSAHHHDMKNRYKHSLTDSDASPSHQAAWSGSQE